MIKINNILKLMKNISQYILESQDKDFSKREIETIIKDINVKDGKFVEFVNDKIDKNIDWKDAYNDYFDQCLDDDRCAAEMALYISGVIGRENFSIKQVQNLIKNEL